MDNRRIISAITPTSPRFDNLSLYSTLYYLNEACTCINLVGYYTH